MAAVNPDSQIYHLSVMSHGTNGQAADRSEISFEVFLGMSRELEKFDFSHCPPKSKSHHYNRRTYNATIMTVVA